MNFVSRSRAGGLLATSLSLAVLFTSGVAVADEPAAAPSSSVAAPKAQSPAETQAAWSLAPGDVALGLEYQDALCSAGRREEALQVFRRHRAERKGDPMAAFLLGRIEGGPDGLRTMWEALDARLGLAPGADAGLTHAWRALAQAEAAASRWPQAADAAAKHADLANTPSAWTDLAGLRERAGDAGAADAAYRRAMALDAEWLPARNGLALLLARSGRAGEGIQLAVETTRKAPRSAEAYIHLGLVRSIGGNRVGALEAYRKALDLAQDDPQALLVLATTYAEMEEAELAKKALERAQSLAPGDGDALVQAGALALQAGRLEEAQETFARAAKAMPADAKVAFLQGVVGQRQGKLETAVVAFKRASTLEPGNPDYALAHALALQDSGKPDSAIEVLEKALERSPQSYDLALRLGFLCMDKRKWTKAVEAFAQAARAAPRDPDPHYYLAVIQGDRLRKTEKAKEHLREYKRLGGQEPSALRWLEDLESTDR